MSAAAVPLSAPFPRYAVRLTRNPQGVAEITVWQMPSPATRQVKEPLRLAGLAGRNLDLVEHRVLRRLGAAGFRGDYGRGPVAREGHVVDEQTALRLALMFRTLAPMRHRDRMRAIADGIEAMGREEAAYWLGMVLHRANPRRVLTALRFLLTEATPSH